MAAVRTDRAVVATSSFAIFGLAARAAAAAAMQSGANNAFPLIFYG
jgi:hypothetical protein